jgi:hypothetical protein
MHDGRPGHSRHRLGRIAAAGVCPRGANRQAVRAGRVVPAGPGAGHANPIITGDDIREILDVTTVDCGVEVTLVELTDIQLPESMKRATDTS